MPSRSEAEEHLRVIRSLMEKATIYRAISVPAAAVGGTLAMVASIALKFWEPTLKDEEQVAAAFLGLWSVVFALATGCNLYFLWREARRRGDRFVSPGMKLALKAVAPSYLTALFFTAIAGFGPATFTLVPIWILCHGLGLLATSHFAPRSLVRLGWAFLLCGFASFVPGITRMLFGGNLETYDPFPVRAAQLWMGLTFGLLHLVYAACAWPRKQAASDSSVLAAHGDV